MLRRLALLICLPLAVAKADWTLDAPAPLAGALRQEWQAAAPADASTRVLRIFARCRAEGYPFARCALDSANQRVRVELGPQARVRAIELLGAAGELRDRFAKALSLRGVVWTAAAFEAAVDAALRTLAESGHAFAGASLVSVEGDAASGAVDLRIWFDAGESYRIAKARVVGATHTQEKTLLRLARVPIGAPYRESELGRIRARLLAREVIAEVEAIEPLRMTTSGEVELELRVRQSPRSGSVNAALGVVREREGESARVSGAVDLSFYDLFGTARRFEAHWLDDGRARRRLDLEFLEPLVFGAFDLRLALGQRHEDELYDTIFGELDVVLPLGLGPQAQLGLRAERSGFVGEERVRQRQALRFGLSSSWRRSGVGWFGDFRSQFSAARVLERGAAAQEAPSQTWLDQNVGGGYAFSQRWALAGRMRWQSVNSDERALPESEWLHLGGANSVRGYAEEQFAADRLATLAGELRLGPEAGAQVYGFYDLGYGRLRRPDATQERWLHGFGLGLRAPVQSGSLDLSLGFAEAIRYENGKLHVALRQEF